MKLWSKKLMREALKETYVSRFMGTKKDSLIYVKHDLTKSAGDRIRIGLRMQLTGAGVVGDTTLEGNEEALTTYTDNLIIDQGRHAVRSGGEMSEQRVAFSVREEALDGLRDWWADQIDSAFFNQIAGNTSLGAVNSTGLQAPTAPTSAAGNVRIMYGGGTTTTEASFTASITSSASAGDRTMQLTHIDRLVNVAKTATPLIRPLRVNGQYKYVMFMHPDQVRQLRQDATADRITWYDIMRARAEGGDIKQNPIYNGALGEYNSVILHESTRIPEAPAVSGTRRAVLCGAQAACFGNGKRDAGMQMKWVEERFDYENELGVAAGMIWGLKKSVYNSIDFGTIVLTTYSPAVNTANFG